MRRQEVPMEGEVAKALERELLDLEAAFRGVLEWK